MKRIISLILIIVLLFSASVTVFSANTEIAKPNSERATLLLEYMQGDNPGLLLNRENYVYMNFIDDFNGNWLALYLLNMSDLLINTGAKPDEQKYIEVLVDIIATYELNNAGDIAEQKKLDNLKSAEDYAMDFVEMGSKAVSVMTGISQSTGKLEKGISTAINGIEVLAQNTDNWIKALSDLETLIQDYSDYDEFLALVEENSDGELKSAAKKMRTALYDTMNIKLETYAEVADSNFDNYSEFFFTNVFFESLKLTAEYQKNDTVKFFVDAGCDFASAVDTLKSAWDLGLVIGKTVGNVVAGGEDVINRILEMMAVSEISLVLYDGVMNAYYEFMDALGSEQEEIYMNKYILLSQYLIDCRIRGEYCMYSTIAKDAGLLSWFGKESAEEAESWYNNKVEKILAIQNKLLIDHVATYESGNYLLYVDDKYIYSAKDTIYFKDSPEAQPSVIVNQPNTGNLLSNGETLFYFEKVVMSNGDIVNEVYSVKTDGSECMPIFDVYSSDMWLHAFYDDCIYYTTGPCEHTLNKYDLSTKETTVFSNDDLGMNKNAFVSSVSHIGSRMYIQTSNNNIIQMDLTNGRNDIVLNNCTAWNAKCQEGRIYFLESGGNRYRVRTIDKYGEITCSEWIASKYRLFPQGTISGDGTIALMYNYENETDFDLYKMNLYTGEMTTIENGAGGFKNKGCGLGVDWKRREDIYIVGSGDSIAKFNGNGYDIYSVDGNYDPYLSWVIDGYVINRDFIWCKIG